MFQSLVPFELGSSLAFVIAIWATNFLLAVHHFMGRKIRLGVSMKIAAFIFAYKPNQNNYYLLHITYMYLFEYLGVSAFPWLAI